MAHQPIPVLSEDNLLATDFPSNGRSPNDHNTFLESTVSEESIDCPLWVLYYLTSCYPDFMLYRQGNLTTHVVSNEDLLFTQSSSINVVSDAALRYALPTRLNYFQVLMFPSYSTVKIPEYVDTVTTQCVLIYN